jgi:hypothetical protein
LTRGPPITLFSLSLSLTDRRAHSRDSPTRQPPRSLFSLARTGPFSPLRSPPHDVRAARSAPPLLGRYCPTALSLAQPRPAFKSPPPSAILPRPSPSCQCSGRPASAATSLPRPTTDKGPQRLIVTVSMLCLCETRSGAAPCASFPGRARHRYPRPLVPCRLSSESPHHVVPSQPLRPDAAMPANEGRLLPSPFLCARLHRAELPSHAIAASCPSVPTPPHCRPHGPAASTALPRGSAHPAALGPAA